jgi:chemotaxis protein MotB
MKPKKPEPIIERVQAAKWMLTMSDLLTLMLTFFVLLISMSSLDDAKIQEAFGMFVGAFGAMSTQSQMGLNKGYTRPFQVDDKPKNVVSGLDDVVERHLRGRFQAKPKQETKSPEIDDYRSQFLVDRSDDAIEVRLAGGVLFKEGSAELTADSVILLREVSDELTEKGLPIRVESYVPPQEGNREQAWNLSLKRAAVVTDVLATYSGTDDKLLSLAGYGRPYEGDERKEREVVRLLFFMPKPELGEETNEFKLIEPMNVESTPQEEIDGR